jgi:hypothetical protein
MLSNRIPSSEEASSNLLNGKSAAATAAAAADFRSALVFNGEGLMGFDVTVAVECYRLTPREMSRRDTRTMGIR